MNTLTHVFTEILYEDDTIVLSKNDIIDSCIYTQFEKLDTEVYDFYFKCDIIKVKSYNKTIDIPTWYKEL